ncbi:hypothetical protein ACOSQ3_010285 [Xanthoceras sorbifolium]
MDHTVWSCSKLSVGWSSCPLFPKLSKLKVVNFLDRILWLFSTQGRGLVWPPPPSGVFKLNVDTSVFKGGCQVGSGSVVRRSDGSLVFAATTVFHGGFAVNVAEALAVLDGLSLATSKGLLPLLGYYKCDALNVVNLYLGITSSRLEIMNVIRDIRRLLLQFPYCSLAHVPHNCNTAAHEVAKFGLLAPVSVFWEVSFPNWLVGLIEPTVLA